MSKTRRGLSFLLCLVMAFSLFAGVPFKALDTEADAASYSNDGVITAWYTAMTNLEGQRTKEALVDKYFTGNGLFATNSTFRSRIQVSAGGKEFRVKLTNYYGSEAINVSKMNVGLPGKGNATAVDENSVVNITVKGSTSFSIPKGGSVVTDWFTMKSTVGAGGYLVFSSYVKNSGKVRDAGLTGSISYCWSGDQVTNYKWTYGALGKLSQTDANVGDYNLTPMLNCIEAKTANTSAYTTVIIGDSTVTNYIPSLLQAKLRSSGASQVAVVGAGIKGNELLAAGVGEDGPLEGDALLDRFDMDALSLTGVKKVFVKIGINDIVHPNCSNLSQYFDGTPSADEIINGYKQLISAAHAKDIEIYFFDISPWIGYTREGTVTTDEATIAQMENVRLEVNKWLKDNAKTTTDDDYMTVDPKTDGSFGLITTSDAIGVDRSGHAGQQVLKSDYTTDNIHYTSLGQSVVANAIPISIFKGVPTGEAAQKAATVGNLYIATNATSGGKYYFFGSDENLPAGSTDQQGEIKLMATDGSATADIKTKLEGGGGRGAYYYNPVNDIVLKSATLQKGTVGAPYFALKSTVVNDGDDSVIVPADNSYKAAYWLQTSSVSSEIRWATLSYPNLYLAWYFPTSGFKEVDVYDTGVRTNSQIKKLASSEWFSFNTISPLNKDTSYKSHVYYGAVAYGFTDKYLSFFYDQSEDGDKWDDVKSGLSFRGVREKSHPFETDGGNLVTLYESGTVGTQLGIEKVSKDQVFYNGANNTVVKFAYKLTDDLLNSPTMTSTGKNVNSLTFPTDNFKTYDKFVGYTYGASADRSVTFTSDNEAVAKIDSNGNVVLTGQGGVANLTMTVTWKELDGTVYTMTDKATVTNITFTADICIDGEYPDSYTFENYAGNGTKDVSVTYTAVPLDEELPTGGSWVWTSGDETIFTVSGSGTNATLHFTDKAGTANLTAAYVKDGVTYCSDTVLITNVTAAVDIQIGSDAIVDGAYPNIKVITGINPGDTLALTAQPVGVGASGLDMTSGTYAWETTGDNAAISDTDKRTSTLTFDGSDTVVNVKLTYKLGEKTYESYVTVVVRAGVSKSNTVVDFGLPVQIELVGSANGISAKAPSAALDTGITLNDEFSGAKSAKTTYGSAQLADSTLTYTPEEILNGVDIVYYSAAVDNGFKYASVNIIPASSIYYEDSFVTYNGTDWKVEGEAKTGVYQDIKDDVYGYDAAYGQYTTYSNGSAHYVTVNNKYGANFPTYTGEYPTASFTFTGTGFAVYSTSDNDAGYVSVKYKNETTGATKKFMVNSFANGDYDQTPTVQVLDLPYGTYTVTLTVVFDKSFDGNNDGHYTYCLDAVRIYEPLKGNVDANNAYAEVGEANAQYKTVRSMLLDANSFGKISAAENGAVFLDSKTRLAYDENNNVTNVDIYGTSVSDYTNYGPKNEVYLGQGQGIAFKIENAAQLADIQLGIKQAGRDSGEVIINGHKIKVTSATDMYYSIKQYMTEDATVVVVNPGSSVISLTVLKTTKNDAQLQTAIIVTPELGKLAAERMMSYVNTPTEPMPIEPTVEPTVEPTEEPQPSKDPTPSEDPEPSVEPTEEPQPSEDPQPDDDDQDQDNALMNILKKIGDFFKKLFGGWKK